MQGRDVGPGFPVPLGVNARPCSRQRWGKLGVVVNGDNTSRLVFRLLQYLGQTDHHVKSTRKSSTSILKSRFLQMFRKNTFPTRSSLPMTWPSLLLLHRHASVCLYATLLKTHYTIRTMAISPSKLPSSHRLERKMRGSTSAASKTPHSSRRLSRAAM